MPNGRGAASTAFATAGADPVVPPSPIPLTPIGLCGDVLEGHETGRNAAYVQPPIGHHDVGGRRLEGSGRERPYLSLEADGSLVNRRSRNCGAAAAEGADGIGRLVRIAVKDPDLLESHAERIGGKLGPGGLVTLAMGG